MRRQQLPSRRPLSPSPISSHALRTLNGVFFDWIPEKTYGPIDANTGRATGLIAQDVQAQIPEAVTETDDDDGGSTLGVGYGSLIGLLVEGIKELKVEVEQLKQAKNP